MSLHAGQEGHLLLDSLQSPPGWSNSTTACARSSKTASSAWTHLRCRMRPFRNTFRYHLRAVI